MQKKEGGGKNRNGGGAKTKKGLRFLRTQRGEKSSWQKEGLLILGRKFTRGFERREISSGARSGELARHREREKPFRRCFLRKASSKRKRGRD